MIIEARDGEGDGMRGRTMDYGLWTIKIGKQIMLFLIIVHGPWSMVHSPLLANPGSKVIESFQDELLHQFPKSFKTWPFQRGKAKKVYQVKEEGENRFLSAKDDQNISQQIFKEFDWKIQHYPYLKWRWRARVLPEGARENDPQKNDSACSVYVIFGKTSGTALKFTWSTSLKEGTVYEKKPGELVMKILESGPKYLNRWRQHSVHIPKTYEELLKGPLKKNPTGFAILTDGNAVQKEAACDYDDFEISSVP